MNKPLVTLSICILTLLSLMALYAPLLASSKPLFVLYDHTPYFPLFDYLFFPGFFTKPIDRFYNLLMITALPLFLFPNKKVLILSCITQLSLFTLLEIYPPKDPLFKQQDSAYAQMTQSVEYTLAKQHHELLATHTHRDILPTKYQRNPPEIPAITPTFLLMPPLSHFHWEEDAGGNDSINPQLPFYLLTRNNRKDLAAALIFGARISITVGLASVCISLLIGLPLGVISAYYKGVLDLAFSRFLEIWEGMPTFFMLLMIVSITETKSILHIILILGIFGWTSFYRFTRSEALRICSLPFIQAAKTLGFKDTRILLIHLLPNAMTSVLTLLPITLMAAITAESGLAFLGLGDENSCSWGTLMDEGRQNFPSNSYLLWPPATLLTLLLLSLAMIGDQLRDTLDPKMQ